MTRVMAWLNGGGGERGGVGGSRCGSARGWWPLLAAALLSACASAPPRKVAPGMPELPEEWREVAPGAGAEADSSAEAWWRRFGDPRLDQLVSEALRANPDLRAMAARMEAAAAAVTVAGADAWPQVSAGGNGSRSKRNFVGFPSFGPPGVGDESGPVTVESNSFGVSLDVAWEVDLWGRVRNGRSAALAQEEAARAQWRGARESVAAQVCKAYFALAEAEGQVALAEETLANRRQAEERVAARYRRGLRGPLDLHLARTERAGAETQLAARRLQLSTARRQLEILLGRYPAAAVEAAELPELGAAPPAGLPADLIARRPDLVAAERALAASDRQAAVARANLYPRIMLTGSSGTASDELRDLTDYGDFGVWTLAASVVQPLFQGGRLRAGVRAADARVEEARAQFVGAALRAYGEVETGLAAEQRLAEEARALRVAVDASRAARELASSRYERGLAGALMLLDAQRSNYDAESRLLELERRRLDNRVNLHLALGGGFVASGALTKRSEDAS